ncbi:hypothetical protein [Streptomyces sp. NPDC093795]|uniref:hypothetical protein n=1 Tax=Streptomyces sp. NPDC093795 TaxID=3366051 RepID=UPI00381CD1CF
MPSEDPGATGRSGGSRTDAPAPTPAAPRGRDTTDRQDVGHASDDGHSLGRGDGSEQVSGVGGPASGTGQAPGAGDGPGTQLLGDVERDVLGQRLHHALAGFVDSPHDSVAEAAEILAEAEQQLIAALKDRREALRAGWQPAGDAGGRGADTEQLRLTLRTYREVTERLLRA